MDFVCDIARDYNKKKYDYHTAQYNIKTYLDDNEIDIYYILESCDNVKNLLVVRVLLYFAIIQNNFSTYMCGLSIFTGDMLIMFLQLLLEDYYTLCKSPMSYPITAAEASSYGI